MKSINNKAQLITITILTMSIFFQLSCAVSPKPSLTSPRSVVPWNSSESQNRLAQSKYRGDFFKLSSFYEPQSNKLFCGPTTGVILLNALMLGDTKATKPIDSSTFIWKQNYFGEGFNPSFSKFTQALFLNEKTDKVKNREIFYGKPIEPGKNDAGLKLAQLSDILTVYGLNSKVFPVKDSQNITSFKQEILSSLDDSDSFIVVNFDRKVLGQNGGGHISPLVAYEESTDSFLILDVNPVASEWFWVESQEIFAAMNTKDGDEYRGFLRVTKE